MILEMGKNVKVFLEATIQLEMCQGEWEICVQVLSNGDDDDDVAPSICNSSH